MEFCSQLTTGTLLKRSPCFLAQVAVHHQERWIYCPNQGALSKCDVLGSRIWFSETPCAPPTWELVEVDGGHLVCINSLHTQKLLREALQNKLITPLENYTPLTVNPLDEQFDLCVKKDNEIGVVQVSPVTLGDEIHRGFFPEVSCVQSKQTLQSLIKAKYKGYRALLIYFALHTGIDRVFPADHLDEEYGCLLRQAIISGVEVLAYRAQISLTQVKITQPIEVCVPARMRLRV